MSNALLEKKDIPEYLLITESDLLKNINIKIEIVESNIDIYNSIARTMATKLKENNQKNINTCFILPVGPRGQYRRFARICNSEKISCKNLITINMDEYLDKNDNLVSEDNPLSFRGFMRKNLFNLLDDDLKIRPENIYFPDPENTSQIEEVIGEIGGVDICFGGIGINGHIAFNEPINESKITVGDFRQLKTRTQNISRDTIVINSIEYGGATEFIPERCITIGMSEIFMAKELKFYLEHNWQSAVFRKSIFMEPTSQFPSTFLKFHKNSSITLTKNVLRGYVGQ